jgi:hypothetical protein
MHISLPLPRTAVLQCLLYFVLLVFPTHAATVNTDALGTYFPGPPTATVNVSSTATVDLSDLAGLTVENDINITFNALPSLLWIGSVTAGEGTLQMNFLARVTLTVGPESAYTDTAWSFGPVAWEGGQFVGYEFSPSLPASFAITVPWGTDLSEVQITLTDLSSVSGPGAVFDYGGIILDDATLTTTSVPETSAALFSVAAASLLLRRRRNL